MMATDLPDSMRQIRSLVTADGELRLSIATIEVPKPGPNEVLVRIEAAPINPSDLGLLLAMADVSQASSTGTADEPIVTAPISPGVLKALAARVGDSMPVGNEGAGVVVAAGEAPEAQALIGRTVGFVGGATYAEYRAVPAMMCIDLPDGTTAAQGASCFVNPLTALGMVETMRMEGHSGLVHTAAASNLGQMLQPHLPRRRRAAGEHRAPTRAGDHVAQPSVPRTSCDSSAATFVGDLTAALVATGATLAFDAIGGGRQAGQILSAWKRR